jgi:hypothetical protein
MSRCHSKCLGVLLLLSSARGESLSPFIESLVQQAEAWKTTPLPGEWKPLAGPPSPSRKQAQSAEPLFGTAAQRIVATEDAGKLTRLDVLFIERGTAAADEAFLKAMRQAASQAAAGLQSKVGKPGQTVNPAAGAATGTVAQEWSSDAATIRLTLEPGSRLYLSILPRQAPVAAAAADPKAKPTAPKGPLKSRVEEKANGDVIITGLPEVALEKFTLDDIMRTSQCLAGYYGWTLDVEAVAKAAGWSEDGTTDCTYEVVTALAKAAKVEVTDYGIVRLQKAGQKLDLLEVRRWIDKGRLLVYRHMYSEVRADYLIDFNKQFTQNPKLELPSPKDPAENSKWLRYVENSNYYSSTTLIIGYNRKRGEFILKYPGRKPEEQIIRIREEELSTSLLQVYYIPPN